MTIPLKLRLVLAASVFAPLMGCGDGGTVVSGDANSPGRDAAQSSAPGSAAKPVSGGRKTMAPDSDSRG